MDADSVLYAALVTANRRLRRHCRKRGIDPYAAVGLPPSTGIGAAMTWIPDRCPRVIG